jgi:predicted glutamine amidotransferase
MCRLGFVSAKKDASLANYTRIVTVAYGTQNPHGTGIAYVEGGKLHVLKSAKSAAAFWMSEAKKNFTMKTKDMMFHTRFRTTGPQTHCNTHPFLNSKKTVAFEHNGVIYNYERLKHDLQARGVKFHGETDSEVLFKTWAMYGNNFTKKLNEYGVRGYITFLALRKNGDIIAYTDNTALKLYKTGNGIAGFSDDTFKNKDWQEIPVHKDHIYTIRNGEVISDRKVEKMRDINYHSYSGYGEGFGRFPTYTPLSSYGSERALDEKLDEMSDEELWNSQWDKTQKKKRMKM